MTPRPPSRFTLKKTRNRPIAPLADVLPAVAQELALDQKVREFAVLALWPTVAGERYRDRSRAIRLKTRGACHELWVKVQDAATAGELSFMTQTLLQTLNAYAPQTGVTISRIRVSIGV